jgi:hypothetical protein
MDSPVLFETIGSRITQRLGEGLAIECGPGKVLKGLLSRITPGFAVYAFGEPGDLDPLREELG